MGNNLKNKITSLWSFMTRSQLVHVAMIAMLRLAGQIGGIACVFNKK